ncbi:MAG: ribonuclease H-like domain-containing protein, partial [Planctomycetota bacterium]
MSENFRSRLRRLRREAGTERESQSVSEGQSVSESQSVSEGQSVSEPVGAEARVPDWLRRRIGRADAAVPSRGGTVGAPRELVELPGGGAERITRFDLGALHGSWPLADVLKADSAVLARLGKDRALAEIDPARAAFLDIETTGLSGGTGTWPYLVAIGRVVDGEFELWQGFMHAPGDEVAVMRATAERLGSAGQVVSFFGKSFDRHRLEDKMRQHGITSPFEGSPHLDLYHVCRRLYGGAYPDGRLATMERELCDVRREDDLPGSFAPAAWFDYQAGRPHLLEDVFKHNLDDVLSLVTLTA